MLYTMATVGKQRKEIASVLRNDVRFLHLHLSCERPARSARWALQCRCLIITILSFLFHSMAVSLLSHCEILFVRSQTRIWEKRSWWLLLLLSSDTDTSQQVLKGARERERERVQSTNLLPSTATPSVLRAVDIADTWVHSSVYGSYRSTEFKYDQPSWPPTAYKAPPSTAVPTAHS